MRWQMSCLRELQELPPTNLPQTPANAGESCGSVFHHPVGVEDTPALPQRGRSPHQLPQSPTLREPLRLPTECTRADPNGSPPASRTRKCSHGWHRWERPAKCDSSVTCGHGGLSNGFRLAPSRALRARRMPGERHWQALTLRSEAFSHPAPTRPQQPHFRGD